METIMMIAVVGTLNAVCFFIGAKVGQKVSKGETLEAPNLNPMDYLHEQKEKRQASKEHNKYQTILDNLERYDGTGYGQKEVPR